MTLAPFYLNLLNNGSFKDEDIKKLLKGGLGRFDDDVEDLATEIIEVLKGNNPVNSNTSLPLLANSTMGYDEMEEDDVTTYEISSFGVKMSPFALSLWTYKRINRLFVTPVEEKNEKIKSNHLPEYRSDSPFYLDPERASDEKQMYFLDVMYQVCNVREIKDNKTYLNVPKLTATSKPDQDRRNSIQKAVLTFFRTKVKKCMLWQSSPLTVLGTTDTQEIQDSNLCPLYRTIVLYYWVQGYDVRDIRKILDLPDREEFYIYTSELEGLGELCAYQLEAISKGIESRSGNSDLRELSGMFYALSIRIKYGMSNDLSRIANKHIRG